MLSSFILIPKADEVIFWSICEISVKVSFTCVIANEMSKLTWLIQLQFLSTKQIPPNKNKLFHFLIAKESNLSRLVSFENKYNYYYNYFWFTKPSITITSNCFMRRHFFTQQWHDNSSSLLMLWVWSEFSLVSFLLWPTFSSVPVNAFDILVEPDQSDLHKPAVYDSIGPVSLKNCV